MTNCPILSAPRNYVTSWDVGSGTPNNQSNIAFDGTYFYVAWMGNSNNTLKRFYSDRTLWTRGRVYINSYSCMAMSVPPLPGDVGTTRIIAPSGDIPYGVPVIPQAKVRNYSSVAQRFSVRFDIDTVYSSIKCVDNLLPDDSVTVSFDTFPATAPGSHAVKCSTQLSADTVPTNDKATDACFVPLVDAGTRAIVAPTDTVDSGVTFAPQAVVENFGTSQETFVVRFTVSDGYEDTTSVTLAASAVDTVRFEDWTADTLGTFATRCSTELAADQNHANDAVSGSVVVAPFTGGVAEQPKLPTVFSLDKAVPNPTSGAATIRFGLPRAAHVSLNVYSSIGSLVGTLCNTTFNPGYHALSLRLLTPGSSLLSSGVYLIRLQVAGFTVTRKLVVQR